LTQGVDEGATTQTSNGRPAEDKKSLENTAFHCSVFGLSDVR
jgi:hypothetical protein